MTNQPKLRYHRAQWDLLEQHGSPAFFYEHSFGSPIETDSDWGSPKSVIETPVAEQLPTTTTAEPQSVAEASSSKTADASEESSQLPSHLDELIRDYRRKVQENRSSCLEIKIGHPTLGPATPSSYVAKAVRASPPNLPSIEQRLERASLNAKANSSTSSNQAERSQGRKIQSKKKVTRNKRDLTPTPKEPQGGSDLTPEIEALLEYQRSVYGVSSNPPQPHRAFGGILGHVCRMINAKAISALLSENVDENTTDWLLFTVYGNLLGYSDNTPIQHGRTVAAMAGGAWRIHNQAITKNDPSLHAAADKFCKTAKIISFGEKEAGLRAMIVIVDDVVVAVHDVKERLLIAAMLPLEAVKQDKASVSENGKGEGKGKGKERADEEASESSEEGNGDGKVGTGEEIGGDSGDEASDDGEEGKAKEGKPTNKQQILVWRAEGMAEVLLGDLRNFKMPEGYF